jgi:PDZ domain-containing secreted protein
MTADENKTVGQWIDTVTELHDRVKATPKGKERTELTKQYVTAMEQTNNAAGREIYNLNHRP